jgi:hypothetical protein
MNRRRVSVLLAAFGLLLWALPPQAVAQAVSGTILGTVKDPSGGAVPGATVTLVQTGTGYSRSAVTNQLGEYTAPSLPTGTYTVSAELTGFKKASLTDVRLGVDQRVRMDMVLQLGQMSEVVEVKAETPLLQTASSDLGTTVVEEQIKSLPLNGRNFVSLTRTVPGILRGAPGGNIDGAGSLAWRASASFSANGQRTRDNNYMLDGVDNNETWLQTVVIFPSPDALAEFKLQTSTYSAEFGRSLGGVVNLQLKSGTNDFHGSVFEFLRNDRFDANNFFNNRAQRAKPDLSQHQGQDVLLHRLPGTAHHVRAELPLHRPLDEDAPGRLLGGQPRHLRSAHGAAIPRQCHSAEPVGPRLGEHPAATLPRAQHDGHGGFHRAAGQQLPDQSQPRKAGQPVRRQGRPPGEHEQPRLRAL